MNFKIIRMMVAVLLYFPMLSWAQPLRSATEEFVPLYQQYRQLNWEKAAAKIAGETREITHLRGYRVILVTGFLNELQLRLGFGNFNPQIDVLEKLGIPFERMTYDESRLSKNAHLLTQRILASPEPVILIAHSLGAQVALEALMTDGAFDQSDRLPQGPQTEAVLMRLCEQTLGRGWVNQLLGKSIEDCRKVLLPKLSPIHNKVAALITLNGNIGGTPLSDVLFDSSSTSMRKRTILRFLNFRPADVMINIMEMSEQVARARLQENQDRITNITQRIPVISVASRVDIAAAHERTSLTYRFGEILQRLGVNDSDGVVPVESAIVPGAETLYLNYVSHFETVKDYPSRNSAADSAFDPRAATLAWLELIERRLQGTCEARLSSL